MTLARLFDLPTRTARGRPFRSVCLIAALALATSLVCVSACGSGKAGESKSVGADITSFFHSFVQRDGRVARTDQGGDTVSEGQAYAMLLAAATGNRSAFASIWDWTGRHLQRDDSLLSWHWADGHVLDPTPATDADLDAAWALAVASQRFDNPVYGGAARRMSQAILAEETATLAGGGLVLTAGPWGRDSPATVNPSYFSPVAYAELFALTGDTRWQQIARSSVRILKEITAAPPRLPPDWTRVSFDGVATPAGPSGGGGQPAYGLDAARTEVWFASSCQSADRRLSAAAWPLLMSAAHRGRFPISTSVEGSPESQQVSPLIAIADAAAAASAGQVVEANALIDAANGLATRYRTYYGTAWVALGRVLLSTHDLGVCPVL